MQNIPLFTAEDKGTVYIVEEGATQDENGYWNFPVYNETHGIHVVVSGLKLRGTKSKRNGLNWWLDSKTEDGMVTAFHFVDFVEAKTGKLPMFPKWFYRAEVIAEHFKIEDEDDVSELIDANYNDLKAPEKSLRRKWMKWAHKQPLAEILHPEYLTPSGKVNADAFKQRYGTLIYEPLERVKLS